MTIAHGTLTNGSPPALAGRTIRVRWSAVVASATDRLDVCTDPGRAHCRIAFILALQLVNEHHALLEAWLETASGIRTALPQQPVACEIIRDDPAEGGLLHVDAHLDGRRILALSLDPAARGEGDDCGRLLYAQSSLPAEAGFAPGACDRPTAALTTAEQDAVSA